MNTLTRFSDNNCTTAVLVITCALVIGSPPSHAGEGPAAASSASQLGKGAGATRVESGDQSGQSVEQALALREILRTADGFIDEMRWNIAQQHSLLETRINERTRQLETAFNFSQEIVQQLNLNLLFESAVQKIKELMRVKSVSLCLVTEDHAGIELVATTAGKPAGEKWIQPIEVEHPLLYSEERAARYAEVSLWLVTTSDQTLMICAWQSPCSSEIML